MDPLKITPPFSYSYQCGSTLLVSYIPVYMYSVSFQLLSIALKLIMASSFSFYLPEMLLIKWFAPITWPLHLTDQLKKILTSHPLTSSVQLIKPHQIISNVISHLILLLSFGLCSPVLGCYITLSVCVSLCCWLMMIGRFVFYRLTVSHSSVSVTTTSVSSMQENLDTAQLNPISLSTDSGVEDKSPTKDTSLRSVTGDTFLDLLNHQVCGVSSSLVVCKWPVISTSCFFVTLLCWEMVGDEVGWQGGLWVPIVGVVMLLAIWIWDRFLVSGMIDLDIHKSYYLSTIFSSPPPIAPLRSRVNSLSTELVLSSGISSSLQEGQESAVCKSGRAVSNC
jgi:hypothetical protein